MKKIVSEYDLTLEPGFDLLWQALPGERFTLLGLLKRLQPKLALEIGTYQGGSLQALSRYSEKVISIDIDASVADRLKGRFPNVEFRSGDSLTLIPRVVDEINAGDEELSFVFIDGDHTPEGVRRDIENLLKLVPRTLLVFILHDSFNPGCRGGILSADWAQSPHVQSVEVDFVPGVFHRYAIGTAEARTMWGGFACAILTPEKRDGPLQIKETQRHVHDAVKGISIHGWQNKWRRGLLRLRKLVKK
jgi:hypothetical protein